MANSKTTIQRQKAKGKNGLEAIAESLSVQVDDRPFTPQDLREYNETNPEFAKQLMEMAVKEQQHRHGLDKDKVKVVKRSQWHTLIVNIVGMISALVVVGAFLFCVYIAILHEANWIAALMGTGGLVALVQLFINKKE